MDDTYEVVNEDGEVVFSEPVGDYSSTTLKGVIAYAIGYASHPGTVVTVRRIADDNLIFSFNMTDTAWNPHNVGRPVS